MPGNTLYYGDNLDVLRRKVERETVDLCYIDPPFNSKRNYNQIYNNIGTEDRARAQAFTDTWVWDDHAIAGFDEILGNASGRFQPKLVDLIKGLAPVLGKGSLLAYLVSMALRITEIHRVLKPTGSFYLHCDPTASHYLKLLLDSVFCADGNGGEFLNEIIWWYDTGGMAKTRYSKKHDTIFIYAKHHNRYTFNVNEVKTLKNESQLKRLEFSLKQGENSTYRLTDPEKYPHDVWQLHAINPKAKERLGYPTQKPETLLERVIKASSNEGDLVLDAYCGCGTTIAVAQRLNRKWIGIDITYQSVSLILRRLEKTFGPSVLASITTDGIPKDMESVIALAHKRDDRLRKEFEKWAVLTYSNNRAVINEKKGADAGIDGTAYFLTGRDDNAKIIFQVKSGGVARKDIAILRGDMGREGAELGYLITLENPSGPMKNEAKGAGQYQHPLMGRPYDRISIVTAQEIVEQGKRLDIPLSIEVVPSAKRISDAEQHKLGI